jgi:hypothetical protein
VRRPSAGPAACRTAVPASSQVQRVLSVGHRPARVHKSSTGTGGRRPESPRRGDDPARRPGTWGGDGSMTVHGRRVVHVSTQEEGHQPTAGQQGHSGPDLGRGVRSPGSTAVMTKMKDFSPGVLEPHSGWGRVGAVVQEQCSHRQGLGSQGVRRERMDAAHRTGRAGAHEHGVGTR